MMQHSNESLSVDFRTFPIPTANESHGISLLPYLLIFSRLVTVGSPKIENNPAIFTGKQVMLYN